MRNFKYSLPPFLAPGVSTTSENLEWPALNVLMDEAPQRPWRTLTTGSNVDIVFDFGSVTSLGCILIGWTNYPAVLVQKSDDNISYSGVTPTGYTSGANGLAIPLEPDLNRRKLLVDLTGLFNNRYLRLRINSGQTTDDGANYYSTGAVTIGSTLTMLTGGMQFPFEVGVIEPTVIKDFPSGGKQINIFGVDHYQFELGGRFATFLQKSPLQSIRRAGRKAWIFYPNIRTSVTDLDSFNPGEACLVRRISEVRYRYTDMPEILDFAMTLDEVV